MAQAVLVQVVQPPESLSYFAILFFYFFLLLVATGFSKGKKKSILGQKAK